MFSHLPSRPRALTMCARTRSRWNPLRREREREAHVQSITRASDVSFPSSLSRFLSLFFSPRRCILRACLPARSSTEDEKRAEMSGARLLPRRSLPPSFFFLLSPLVREVYECIRAGNRLDRASTFANYLRARDPCVLVEQYGRRLSIVTAARISPLWSLNASPVTMRMSSGDYCRR